MKIAAIDIGSNTVRMKIGEVAGRAIRPLMYEREVTRLASGLVAGRGLSGESMQRTFDAIGRFMDVAKREGVTNVLAAGTSAIREAGNSGELLSKVKHGFGLEVLVMDEELEALTTAKGVVSSFDTVSGALILDIGGGSTEAIVYGQGNIRGHMSAPVGVVKLADKYLKSDPPAEGDLTWIEAEAASHVLNMHDRLSGLVSGETVFISTAGTPTTIAAIDLGLDEYDAERVHGHVVGIDKLRALYEKLVELDNPGRFAIRGMEPGREDLIIPGIILTIKLMEAFEFDRMRVSDKGLLDGLLQSLAQDLKLI